jgi:signal peptidase II
VGARPEEESVSKRRSPYGLLALLAAIVVLFDQTTKEVALRTLSDGPIDVIDGVLRWRLAFNPGGAFGVFSEHSEIFLVATLIVVVLVVVWARTVDDPRLIGPLGLIVGGGLGNVFDRIFRDQGGRVVDFIDLHVWPVFNVADMAVVSGVVLVLILSFRAEDK